MTRRQATARAAMMMMFGMALGKMDVLKAEGGLLTVDLNQWGSVQFKYRKEVINVSVAEVFAALKEAAHGS